MKFAYLRKERFCKLKHTTVFGTGKTIFTIVSPLKKLVNILFYPTSLVLCKRFYFSAVMPNFKIKNK